MRLLGLNFDFFTSGLMGVDERFGLVMDKLWFLLKNCFSGTLFVFEIMGDGADEVRGLPNPNFLNKGPGGCLPS